MSRPKLTLKTFQKEEVDIPNPKPKRVGRPRKNIEEKTKKQHGVKVTARVSDLIVGPGQFVEVDTDKKEIQKFLVKQAITPLMYAAAAGNITKVKQLIANGEDIRLKDRNGICARGYALENDHMEIVKLLSDVLASDREKSRKINQSSSITFIEGNRREFEEVTKSLKEDNFGLTVLMIAGIISAALSIVGLMYYFVSEIVS